MSDNKNNMVVSAMNYAIPLGLFWIFKYLFVILSEYSELSKYILVVLNIGTPILLYIFLSYYREKDRNGNISYGGCILYTLLLFTFASVLEVVAVSLHIYVISPAYVAQIVEQVYQNAQNFNFGNAVQQAQYNEIMSGFMNNIRPLIIISHILGNIILGFVLSLILGFFVSNKTVNRSQKK